MMPRIDVDDDVFKHLQSNAIAYVESPNDTLRRLLGLQPRRASISRTPPLTRRPKASLGRLIAAGLITNGQKLFLHDYQGRRVQDAVAYVGGDGVFPSLDRKRLCSMSDLAAELLKKTGYKADAVRGPSHWRTEDGRSITEIWDAHLDQDGN